MQHDVIVTIFLCGSLEGEIQYISTCKAIAHAKARLGKAAVESLPRALKFAGSLVQPLESKAKRYPFICRETHARLQQNHITRRVMSIIIFALVAMAIGGIENKNDRVNAFVDCCANLCRQAMFRAESCPFRSPNLRQARVSLPTKRSRVGGVEVDISWDSF